MSGKTTATPRRIAIRHEFYGCDTGCCGSTVEDADTGEILLPFDFFHVMREDLAMISVKLGYDVELVVCEECP